jgi:hypothetical protein
MSKRKCDRDSAELPSKKKAKEDEEDEEDKKDKNGLRFITDAMVKSRKPH